LMVFTLVVSFGSGSAAFAGESLMESASRIVQQASQPADRPASVENRTGSAGASRPDAWVNRRFARSAEFLAQGQPVLSKSGMKKRTKALIYVGLAIGFAASAYAIDHHVLNVTPSSLGTRKD
jgi:hypothetical protein